jgi:hypothetical protein
MAKEEFKVNPATNVNAIIAGFTTGQGRAVNCTNGKGVDLLDSGFVDWAETLPEEYRTAFIAYNKWKASGYDSHTDELTALEDAGYLAMPHYYSVNGTGTDTSSTANPMARKNRVLTASEYRENSIKLGIMGLSPDDMEPLLNVDGNDSKVTKAMLIDMIHALQAKLFTEEQRATYGVMLEKEEQEAAKWKALTDAGFTDITSLGQNKAGLSQYIGNVSIDKRHSAVEALDKAGYTLDSADFDKTNFDVMKLIFTERAEEQVNA